MTSVKHPTDRRRHPRAITRFSAVLTVTSSGSPVEYDTRVINLSLGGALLDFVKEAPRPPVTVNERVLVNIRCRGGSGPVSLEGRAVLWHAKADSTPLLAVQFDEVAGEKQETLEELIAEALAEIEGRVEGLSIALPSKGDTFWP